MTKHPLFGCVVGPSGDDIGSLEAPCVACPQNASTRVTSWFAKFQDRSEIV